MPATLVRLEDPSHVAVVTLDRPAKANALDPETLRDLAGHWQEIDRDESIRVAVLTGAGDRVFCSGMDMHSTIAASQALVRGEQIEPDDFEGLRAVGRAMLIEEPLRVPLIAAVNGHARAGGFDLMLASQIRYAVPHATFALEEVALGLYPTGHATVALPRQIAAVHAAELLYTARPVDAARALEMGLVNEIVAADRLLERALDTARQIARNAPLAVEATLRGVRQLESLPREEAYQAQEAFGRPLRATRDAAEAQRAFFEKRAPRFERR